MGTTHFKGPIEFSSATPALENLNIGTWPDQQYYMEDFQGKVLDTTNWWTALKDAGAPTIALVGDGKNGELLLSSQATTDNSGSSIQQGQEVWSLPTLEKDTLYFETRVKASAVATMDMYVGLSETFTTNPEAVLLSANLIGIQLINGSGQVVTTTEAAGTGVTRVSTEALGLMADATYITLGFVARNNPTTSRNRVDFYVNRNLLCTHNNDGVVGGTQTASTIPTANMKLALFELSGNATGTKTLTVDYVMAAQDRSVTYSPARN